MRWSPNAPTSIPLYRLEKIYGRHGARVRRCAPPALGSDLAPQRIEWRAEIANQLVGDMAHREHWTGPLG
jgi:hypothetical protein